jgi:alpha-mannosidase
MLEGGRRLADLPGFPRLAQGRADEFFARLERSLDGRKDVPIWDGELYLEYHRGTYTGQARQKRRNALAQRLYHAAELYAACARTLMGASYPREQFEEGWRLILTNQFHDILPGSAISHVYVDAEADFQRLSAIGNEVLETATDTLTQAIGLESESVVVFNPQPFDSADYLELPPDCQPAEAPSQRTVDDTLLVYCDKAPANGYAALALGKAAPQGPTVRATEREVESPFWRIELDEAGRITRIFDKGAQREIVPPGEVANRLVAFEDKPLNFDAWDIDAYYAAKSREVETESVSVLENGPERVVLELGRRIGERTRINQRMQVYARLRRIDFVTRVEWYERQSLLKVAFPTTIRNRRATYEIQFGSIDRPTHRNTSWEEAAFEVPAQRWADLSDAHYGVAVLADCKHGYSVHDGTLWLSLLKGAIDPDPLADVGEHEFTYSLLPHSAGLHEVRRAAYSLTRPLLWRRSGPHPGSLPRTFSLARTNADGVVVETAKWAEDEDALIVRAYEPNGGLTRSAVSFGMPTRAVDAVDLLERNPRPVAASELEFRAREIKTLRVSI